MYKVVLQHSLVLALGAAVGRVIPYAFIFWLSARLSHTEYNTISAMFMWSTFVSTVVGLGLSTVMTQRVAQAKTDMRAQHIACAYYQLLVAGLLLAAFVSYAFGNTIFDLIFKRAVVPGLYVPAMLSGLGWPQLMFFIALANATRKGLVASVMAAAGGCLQGVGMLAGYLAVGRSVQGALWGLACGSLVAAMIGYFLLEKSGISLLRIWAKKGLRCLRYAYADTRSIMMNSVSSCAVMPIGFLSGSYVSRAANGQAELAQYYFLEQISQFVVYFPALLGQVLMPYVSKQYHAVEKDKSDFIRLSLRLIGLLLTVATSAAAVIGLFGHGLIHLAHSAHLTEDSLWPARLMVFNALLTLPLTVLGAIINGTGSLKFGATVNIIWGGCVVLTCLSIPDGGNFAFQLARVIASLSIVVISTFFLVLKSNKVSRELAE